MDKRSIIGIAVIAVLFLVFAYFNTQQQEQYREQKAVYDAYQDSVARANAPAPTVVDERIDVAAAREVIAQDSIERQMQTAAFGESLATARYGKASEFNIENDMLSILFSSKGGQIKGVTLKDYEKYAPKGRESSLIEMMEPSSANFSFEFFIKNGLNNVKVNTAEYNFTIEPTQLTADGAQVVVMSLPISQNSRLVYRYTVHNVKSAERDYLVDFDVEFVDMSQVMANQSTIALAWSNSTYQNEKGFTNENNFTTIAYREPDTTSIEELGFSDEDKSESVDGLVNWIAFKQQFFSSVVIAPEMFSSANLAYTTAPEGSGMMKSFTAQMTIPYSPQTTAYDLSLYFGPNKYSTLNKIVDADGEGLYLERLVPLGWGIFGWVNRWCVIPVFDFLNRYINSFGLIILILVILVKLVISPLTYRSYVSMAKMRLLKPQVDELAKKYPKSEDAMKRQQATMELYKKAGANPMGGCIPVLIQFPILIAMFRFFPASIELRDQPFLWADDLSSYDSILNLPFSIPFYGDHVSLFALLMAISTFGYSYFSYQQSASSQPQMAGMKFMMVYMMPIMLLFVFNGNSSGLCYYYFLSNLFTIGQTLVIRRMVDDTKINAIMQAAAAKKASNNGKKSKFQQRYEQMLQEQQNKKK